MLRVYADRYIELGQRLADARAHLAIMENENDPEEIESRDEMLADDLSSLLETCEALSLSTSVAVLKPRIENVPDSEGEFILLLDTVIAELKSKLFLFVPSHVAQYYEWDGIVTDVVVNAFPKASEEIRAGGSCFAAGLHTACVFHAMRAAEIGLRSLGTKYNITIKSGKDIALAEWREILDGLNTAVQRIENLPNSTPNKEEDLQFCSEAAAQFRFFKNGWRVRAAHARATYSESQAKEAIDHVRSFFEILAPRLKE